MHKQYDMFEVDAATSEILQEECRDTRMYVDKLRRSFFARMNEQFKIICELRKDIEELKKTPQLESGVIQLNKKKETK